MTKRAATALVAISGLFLGLAPVVGQSPPVAAGPVTPSAPPKGWMDVLDSPVRPPGPCPWLARKDNAEQARLRQEVAHLGRIVYCSNRDGNWEIYSCKPDGSDQKNLTNHAAWDFYPRWTPDGKRIVFFSDRDAPVKMSALYDQLVERPTTGPWGFHHQGPDFAEPWRREARIMDGSGIYIMDADGSNPTLIVKRAQYASVSPDGRFLVFERHSKAVARDLETGEEFDAVHKYFGAAYWPEYSPDASRILVAASGDTMGSSAVTMKMMATIVDLTAACRPTSVYWNLDTGGMTLCPRWRPDGNGVLIVQGSREMHLQEIDLAARPNPENGWMPGKTIGLAKPPDRWIHAYPAYCPAGTYVAFSLSPVHYLVRELPGTDGTPLKDMGYKPWGNGNQIAWQELCVGRAVAGQDNVYIQLTEGGFANRNADWWVPPERRMKPAKPMTAEAAKASWRPAPTTRPAAHPQKERVP